MGFDHRDLPDYIVGGVIATASTVEIRLGNGDVLRVPTFAGKGPVEHIRFYATPPPPGIRPTTPSTFGTLLESVAGLDADGNVVACLAPATAKDGISPLSDCR